MESIGNRLKKIRLEKGVSLEEAHKKTKLPLNILKAIEEDSLINFNPVYIKGFLKIYCKSLGLDHKEYMSDYKEAQPKAKPQIVSIKERGPAYLFRTGLFRLISSKFIDMKIIRKVLLFILMPVFIIVLFNLGKAAYSKRVLTAKKAKSFVDAAPKITTKAQVNKPRKEQAGSAAGTVNMRPEQRAKTSLQNDVVSGVRLTIRARENCWLQLKADGRVIYQKVLIKGRSETWQAKEKIELNVSNAGVVELQVNDKFYSHLGRNGQAIKNIVITREGLNIGR